MPSDVDERLERADEILVLVLKPARWPRTAPVTITARHLDGEPLPYPQALDLPAVAFAEGDRWGPDWGTTWFHVTGTVPPDWAGRHVVLTVHLGYSGGAGFGAEGLVWIDGTPVRGISPNHRDVPIATPAQGGEAVDLLIEAAANPSTPETDPGALLAPDPGGPPRLELRRCHLAVVDRAVEALVRDWTLVRELVVGDADPEITERSLAALAAAADAVDPDDVGASVPAARRALATVLERRHSTDGPIALAVGNSHLDTAWLWPLREARRKAARTFSNAVTLLDEHPEFTFAASQALHFAWIRDDHPDLFERIRSHVRAGRFDLIGSMWVEADANLPSGESLVRQIVHGRRFFRDELGVDTPGLWLPDVFGYPASLPQILREAGIEWFLTQKISWNQTNRFPHHTFWWEGIDGSRVFAHFPPADTYAGDLSVAQLRHGERNFAQADRRSRWLYLYGHGDGGGGPDADQIERLGRVRDLDGLPRVEPATASAALEALMAEGDPADLPVWVGELYLEMHRGTYTTHGEVKQANRRLELALRDAELWSVAAHGHCDRPPPLDELESAWRRLLVHQFHDVLPGSGIHWVYEDAASDHATVGRVAERLTGDALGALAEGIDTSGTTRPVLVANPLAFGRREVVDVDGELHVVEAPACGWALVDLADPPSLDLPPVQVGDGFVDNGILRAEWDADGLLTSVRHLPSGREVLAPGRRGNVLQVLDDRPAHFDAWDIDPEAFVTAVDVAGLDRLEVVEADDLRATVRIDRSVGASRITQLLRLSRGSDRLEVHCTVDWHEDHTLLKVAFPVDVRAPTARHEIQFGHVERPTHANTSWDQARFETCAHTWVDLSEHGFGVALVNDAKYGHDVAGSTLRLSLLRSPTWPDPLADRGRHTFAYALVPHAGSFADGGVVRTAHAFNSPLRVVPLAHPGSGTVPARHSVVEVDDAGVVVTAVKPADDGRGVVVRLHEAHGGRRSVTLRVPGTGRAERVDLLEEALDLPPLPVEAGRLALDLGPFELVTLRLTP